MSETSALIRRAIREGKEMADQLRDQASRAPERRESGRYTIEEAIKEIQSNAGNDAARGIRSALNRAIKGGELTAYSPGSAVPSTGSDDTRWLECYGDDLNTWLAKEVPRLNFRFATPDGAHNNKMTKETTEQRQARRYQQCLDAGLDIKIDTYARLPNGIGALAKKEGIRGISTQAYSKDVKAHIERLVSAQKTAIANR